MVRQDASPQDQHRLGTVGQSPMRRQSTPMAPSLRAQLLLQSNLPAPITSFIGRERELADIQQFLAAARLVTLTGAGGVGKTRLALRAAAEAAGGYADGVWLVELAPLADPALVPHAVAAALGVRDKAGLPLRQTLKQWIGAKRTLLLLDNCEHLAEGCADFVEDLLGGCPSLQVLATSREPLGASGEVVWRVPSLDLPDAHTAATTDQVNAHAATQLFVERARAARPDFVVTSQNASAIVELCRRLDGIPLAMELAATRIRLLSIENISARLDDRFRLLSEGRRTAPPRQQTLRATLDWSYALLEDSERQLFNRLSVFAGGWTLEAAEAVCAGEGIDPADVLNLMGRLVDQSLVMADERGSQVRYRLLETVREYAAEKLVGSGVSAIIGGRHRDWFLAQAERSRWDIFDPDHVAWLGRELDNFRVALRWSIQRGEVEVGLRLANATSAFWYQVGAYTEGRSWTSCPSSTCTRGLNSRLGPWSMA
jgi:predicted ATPase